ncbi:hypothetical protein SteCoe_29060 [Stentor coeruleus]|uniref:Peptidase A1 domain-containing protein n=1 Tax=Stentor coeruleus TaxID=5963 RepID=A0A1R2B6Y0_9CILI|nr:hypothetical protein SteCoe_29060 [Stentor coeruleus]
MLQFLFISSCIAEYVEINTKGLNAYLGTSKQPHSVGFELELAVITKQTSLIFSDYNCSSSPSFKYKENYVDTEVLPGLVISGVCGIETIEIFDFDLTFPVICVKDVKTGSKPDFDILFSLSPSNTSFISSLTNKTQFNDFSLFFNSSDGLVLGLNGYNTSYTISSDEISLESISKTKWELETTGVSTSGYLSFSTESIYFDLTFNGIRGPLNEVEPIFEHILSLHSCTLIPGLFYLECDCSDPSTFADFSINAEGSTFSIPGFKLLNQLSENTCEVMIHYHDYNYWSFGQVFFSTYLTVFNMQERTLTMIYSIESSYNEITDNSQNEEETEDQSAVLTMDNLILTAEVIVGCFVIFVIARIIYGVCMKIEFVKDDDPVVPLLSPRNRNK